MIPSIANIRKAIYCLNKRIDLLEGGEYSNTVTELSNKVAALESLLDDDALNPTEAIDKFNEIVAFLNSIDNTETLLSILSDYTTIANLNTLLSNKVDKVANATNGNLSEFDANGNLTDSGIAANQITELENTAVRTGSYDATVAVGLADNLRGDTIVDAEFYKRKTGGTQSVGSGIAAIKEVRGKSIVWNQLIQNGDFSQGITGWQQQGNYGTIQVNNNVLTFIVEEKSANTRIKTTINATVEHKYLVIYGIYSQYTFNTYTKIGGVYSNPQAVLAGVFTLYTQIGTVGGDDNEFRIYLNTTNANIGDTVDITNVQAFDLTLMFGEGNEPATVEEFEKMFPLDYYDYNEGEVIPFAGQNLVTIGKNQYNPVTGKANLLGGQTYQLLGTYTKIYPTVTLIDYAYGNTVTVGTYYTYDNNHYVGTKTVETYDNTKTYSLGSYCIDGGDVFKCIEAIETAEEIDFDKWLAIAGVAEMVTEGIFTLWDITPDANGLFTLTKNTEVTIVGGNNTDTIVALYNGENVTFEPYEKHTLPLDPSQWRDKDGNLVFPYGGMHGVGTAYDYAKVDADGYIRKAVRCFGQVDLGTLSWNSLEGTFSSKDAIMLNIESYYISNSICSIYMMGIRGGFDKLREKALDKTYNYVTNGKLFIKDLNYTDANTFKTAMNGVMLIYRFNTPVEVELATPVYAKYLVDKDGTEEITPANSATPYTTMANLSILYAMDARGEIKNLPKNYLSKESAENMLNAMVSAGVIASYTMTYDATNGRYAFVITAPVEPEPSPEPTPEPEESNE